jgi:hypothetical protein
MSDQTPSKSSPNTPSKSHSKENWSKTKKLEQHKETEKSFMKNKIGKLRSSMMGTQNKLVISKDILAEDSDSRKAEVEREFGQILMLEEEVETV